jgi:4-amino-4-deoxy-L-arabinose transferase-like glycosyltransferase
MRSSTVLSWLRSEWRWLAVSILAAHFLLSAVYSVATPIWEGPDELGHYRHVRFLVSNLSLPGPEDSSTPLDQLTHPPLYYIVASILTSWVDTSDNLNPVENPFAPTGTMEGGANRFLHSDAEAFPYRGTALAVHMARLVSILIGTLSVFVTYRLGRLLFPERHDIALGAAAINAFSPGFLFMSGVINNDIMVTLFTALTLLFAVRVILRNTELRDLLALGVCTSLALLSKYNALALVPLVVIAVGVAVAKRLRRRRSLAMSLGGVFLLLLSAALIYAWWLMRSVALYGAPTTRSARILARFLEDLRDPAAGLTRLDWSLLPDGLDYFYRSFWGVFGWGNINAATWLYQLCGVLCLAGLVGLVLFLLGKARRPVKGAALLLLVAFVLFSVLAIYRTLTVSDSTLRGRYALPAMSGVSVLLALGVTHLTPRRLGRLPILLAGVALLFMGLVAPFRYIMPVYARPPILSAESGLSLQNPLDIRFGEKIELAGYELGVSRATAGQFIPITLYWRALVEMEENYTVGLSLLGPDGKPYGQVAAYPGHGNYPTSLWNVGEIIKDSYLVRVGPRFPAPALVRFYVALYTYPEEEHLPVLNSEGLRVDHAAILGGPPVELAESPEYDIEHPLHYRLGDEIALVGFDLEDSLFISGYGCFTLYWQALGDITEDYTVFVHVMADEDQPVVQSDSQPRGDFYPTTFWQEGEIIADQHCMGFADNVRPGSYEVFAGMYRPQDMQRLAAFDADGGRIPTDRCPLLVWEAVSPSRRFYVPLALR